MICYFAVILGFKIWYTERLKFTHKIKQDRLNWDYLLDLSYTNGKAQIYLKPYTDFINGEQKSIGFLKKLATTIMHLLSLTKKNGLQLFKKCHGDDKKLRAYFYLGRIKELLKINFSYKEQYQQSIQYCEYIKNKKLSTKKQKKNYQV